MLSALLALKLGPKSGIPCGVGGGGPGAGGVGAGAGIGRLDAPFQPGASAPRQVEAPSQHELATVGGSEASPYSHSVQLGAAQHALAHPAGLATAAPWACFRPAGDRSRESIMGCV